MKIDNHQSPQPLSGSSAVKNSETRTLRENSTSNDVQEADSSELSAAALLELARHTSDDRIAKLKQQVADGTYDVDAVELSRKLIDSMNDR